MDKMATSETPFPIHYFEDLEVGMEAGHTKRITDYDIITFANMSGDCNPVHLDDAFAAESIFKERIAHGILTASLFSTILGTKLPGPGAIYLSQSLNFRAPVKVNDVVVATARIAHLLPEKKRAIMSCICQVNGKTVLDGEAVILVPSRSK